MADASEREIQHATRLVMGRHPNARLFRNNVGECDFTDRHGKRQHVVYGLCRGSSDLIGFRSLTHLACPGCGMNVLAGGPLAQFAAAELKAQGGRLSPEQRMFIEAVRRFGGLAGVCYSPEEVVELFETPLPGL